MFRLKIIFSLTVFMLFSSAAFSAEGPELSLKASPNYKNIEIKVIKKLQLPAWYHEGLFYDGKNMWVANGNKGKLWIVDVDSGAVLSEIAPVADFMEGMTRIDSGYLITEWYAEKLYRARIEDGKINVQSDMSLAPAHPAGLVWTGERLYVITWTRGLGTKFDLLEMDGNLKLIRKIRANRIEEPAHMTWDGAYLWITSWYNRRVYKIDVKTMEILGSFLAPVKLPTGIAWDGKYMWLTGTYGDLYKLEIQGNDDPEGVAMDIKIVSSAFGEGAMIPKKYTCDGEESSPPLEWSGIPASAKSIALISDDPDAPMGTWVHWVIFNIPPKETGLAEGIPQKEVLPNGARQGINSSRHIGYDGPCPPSGTHRYYFKVYALDKMLDLEPGITKKDLLKAMEGHVLGQAQLMGKYKR